MYHYKKFIYHRVTLYTNRTERSNQLLQEPDVVTVSIEEVSYNAKPVVRQLQKLPKKIKKLIAMLPHQEVCSIISHYACFTSCICSHVVGHLLLIFLLDNSQVNEEEASLFDMLWLLLASVIFVPIFQNLPGGN